MIIQCPECRTRFRFPDERMKPTGVKVKCARCMHPFLALSPAQQVSSPTEPKDIPRATAPPPLSQTSSVPPETPAAASGKDPLSASAPPAEVSTREAHTAHDSAEDEDSPSEFSSHTPEDVFSAELESSETRGAGTFNAEDPSKEGGEDDNFSFGDDAGPGEDFSFDDAGFEAHNEEFSFEQTSEEDLDGTFAGADESDTAGDFDFDEDSRNGVDPFAFDGPKSTVFDEFEVEGNAALDSSFDLEDDADFTSNAGRSAPSLDEEAGDDLGFGRIDFSEPSSSVPRTAPAPTIASKEPALSDAETEYPAEPKVRPAAAKPAKKRSAMGGLLGLVLVFLLLLVGLAGYVVWQGGPQEMIRILDRAGVQSTAAPAPAGQIRLSDLRSFFVQNAETGQLFVITGQAINDFNEARSAIAIKGVLYNAQGESLMQQTVFAGNPLADDDLRQLPFSVLEERMNNQFGQSLSNLNVVPGRSIPFTIVFKDLPGNLAEFTVEITDSRPGSGQ